MIQLNSKITLLLQNMLWQFQHKNFIENYERLHKKSLATLVLRSYIHDKGFS